jgi:nitroreductase
MDIVNAKAALDAQRVEPFAAEVGRALDAGATRLLVDLSRADDVAAACQNVLLAARQRLFGAGRIAGVLSPAMVVGSGCSASTTASCSRRTARMPCGCLGLRTRSLRGRTPRGSTPVPPSYQLDHVADLA